jgi:hypothetical protein
MSNVIPPERPRSYADEASELAEALEKALAALRGRAERGDITWNEAAEQRVQILEANLEKMRALRIRHFGDGELLR